MPGGWGKANPKDLSIDFLDDLDDDEEDIGKGGVAAAMPEPSGVLYANPNPDGSRKNCENCMMFSRDNRCSIMAAGQVVKPDMVCGYHVFGEPMVKRPPEHPDMAPVPPKLSGLETVKGGTSCDNCVAYRDGECLAVYENGKPAKVEALGCCARWVAK